MPQVVASWTCWQMVRGGLIANTGVILAEELWVLLLMSVTTDQHVARALVGCAERPARSLTAPSGDPVLDAFDGLARGSDDDVGRGEVLAEPGAPYGLRRPAYSAAGPGRIVAAHTRGPRLASTQNEDDRRSTPCRRLGGAVRRRPAPALAPWPEAAGPAGLQRCAQGVTDII